MGSTVGAIVAVGRRTGTAVAGAAVAGATVAGAGVAAGAQADRPSAKAKNNPTNNEIFFDISTLLFLGYLISYQVMVEPSTPKRYVYRL